MGNLFGCRNLTCNFSLQQRFALTIRYAFHSLFGDHVSGILGDVIDILAVFATLFGLATSLGLGAQQVAGGLDHIFGIANTGSTKVVIVLIITSIAIISVIRGMDRGVKLLSEINIALAFALFRFRAHSFTHRRL